MNVSMRKPNSSQALETLECERGGQSDIPKYTKGARKTNRPGEFDKTPKHFRAKLSSSSGRPAKQPTTTKGQDESRAGKAKREGHNRSGWSQNQLPGVCFEAYPLMSG